MVWTGLGDIYADPENWVIQGWFCPGQPVPTDRRAIPRSAQTPPAPPPPDPGALAEQAIARLSIPKPGIHLGPDDTTIAVNLWTWMWIDDPGTLTTSATDRTVTVTVTARLRSVTWRMGEPKHPSTPHTLAPPVVCDNPGRPPDLARDTGATIPPCGYRYTWRSTPSRTNGRGSWPITATASWQIEWSANTGAAGADTVTTASSTAATVGEFRSVLVYGS